jgi:hypothetical protein
MEIPELMPDLGQGGPGHGQGQGRQARGRGTYRGRGNSAGPAPGRYAWPIATMPCKSIQDVTAGVPPACHPHGF